MLGGSTKFIPPLFTQIRSKEQGAMNKELGARRKKKIARSKGQGSMS